MARRSVKNTLSGCKTDAFTEKPPLMICVIAAAVFRAAEVPDEEDSPRPWNSSQAFRAERHRFRRRCPFWADGDDEAGTRSAL